MTTTSMTMNSGAWVYCEPDGSGKLKTLLTLQKIKVDRNMILARDITAPSRAVLQTPYCPARQE